jgi:type I restriction enzyme R subunit
VTSPNFSFLSRHSPELVEIAGRAERYFSRDPITSLIWTRQFGEYLAQLVAARSGLLIDFDENQVTLLNRLRREAGYPARVIDSFNYIRRAGNSAVHERQGDHQAALSCLRKCRDLSIWFHMTFVDRRQQLGAFVVPSDEFHTREEVERLNSEIETAKAAARDAIAAAVDVRRRLETEVGDRETWQNLAIEAEREKARLLTELLALQEQLQEARGPAQASAIPPSGMASKLSEEGPEYLEDRLVFSISRSTDALMPSGADRVSPLQNSFNVRLKKLQAKFRSMSIDERKKLSKLASLAAKFID